MFFALLDFATLLVYLIFVSEIEISLMLVYYRDKTGNFNFGNTISFDTNAALPSKTYKS